MGTLPFRLTVLDYGAGTIASISPGDVSTYTYTHPTIDLVWSEELVDKRVIGSVRKYNRRFMHIMIIQQSAKYNIAITKTIEYWKENKLTFSTHENERGKVIFQLGTADPDLALKAALTV